MKYKISLLVALSFFLSPSFSMIIGHPAGVLQDHKYSEREKIELLLESIKGLKDVKFERNGTIHEADAAVRLMKSKLNKVGVDNITARDFIDKIASKSSTSGKLYYIVYPDGEKVPVGEFLKKKLSEIEAN